MVQIYPVTEAEARSEFGLRKVEVLIGLSLTFLSPKSERSESAKKGQLKAALIVGK